MLHRFSGWILLKCLSMGSVECDGKDDNEHNYYYYDCYHCFHGGIDILLSILQLKLTSRPSRRVPNRTFEGGL